ncbi:hypothetical protein MBLNU459_g4299t2 [Dothideomycetes sp. NU459]
MDVVNELLGDTVMLLPGHFVTLNSHWEDWNLPNWYHGHDTRNGTRSDNRTRLGNTANVTKRATASVVNRKRQVQDFDVLAEAFAEHIHASDIRPKPQRVAEGAELNDMSPENTSTEHDSATEGAVDRIISPGAQSSPPLSFDLIAPADKAPAPHSQGLFPVDHEEGDRTPGFRPDPSTILPPPTEDSSYSITYTEDSPPPEPIDPKTRPLYHELFDLESEASVLHFTALGKPWSFAVADVQSERPNAHPLFMEQFKMWRTAAINICPAGQIFVV